MCLWRPPLAICAIQGKRPLWEEALQSGHFPCIIGENRISQGVEDWGSLISVPQALREVTHFWIILVDISIFIIFFGSGEGEGGYHGATERGGVGSVLKVPQGGGSPGDGWGEGAGRVSAGMFGGGGGGGQIFFFGAQIPTKNYDPRVPLQRSKLENRENDIFAVKKCLFGVPLGTI